MMETRHPGFVKEAGTVWFSQTARAQLMQQQREEQIKRIESHEFNEWRLGPPQLLRVPSKRTPGSIIEL